MKYSEEPKERNQSENNDKCADCMYYDDKIGGCPLVGECEYSPIPLVNDIIIRD